MSLTGWIYVTAAALFAILALIVMVTRRVIRTVPAAATGPWPTSSANCAAPMTSPSAASPPSRRGRDAGARAPLNSRFSAVQRAGPTRTHRPVGAHAMTRLLLAGLLALSAIAPAAAQPFGYGPGPGRGNPELRAERFECRQEARARGYRGPPSAPPCSTACAPAARILPASSSAASRPAPTATSAHARVPHGRAILPFRLTR